MKRFVLASVGAATLFAFGNVRAENLLDFCVDAKAYYAAATTAEAINGCANAGATATGFTADKITGSYVERVLGLGFDAEGLLFKAITVFNFTTFSYDEGSEPYGAEDTGLGDSQGYRMYGVIESYGHVVNGGSTFRADSATLNVYLNNRPEDVGTSLGLTSISKTLLSDGGTPLDPSDDLYSDISFTGDNGAPDLLLASTSDLIFGSGTAGTSGGTDGFAVSFKGFTLAPAGEAFFIAPRPFHTRLYADGSILDGTLTQVGQVIDLNGSGDARFVVPEPGTLALAGLALVGFAASRRRTA